jgi:hypothetical protein
MIFWLLGDKAALLKAASRELLDELVYGIDQILVTWFALENGRKCLLHELELLGRFLLRCKQACVDHAAIASVARTSAATPGIVDLFSKLPY